MKQICDKYALLIHAYFKVAIVKEVYLVSNQTIFCWIPVSWHLVQSEPER